MTTLVHASGGGERGSVPLSRPKDPVESISASPDQAEILKPYVPRLVLEWVRQTPDASYRRIEGTLVFVDISGFTKMCERLARRGKIGAEEVNDVLDLCFTHLLSIAYEYGGGVIKWGGDAVLLLFTGESHAPRAARAAFGMRDALRRFRHFQTSAGFVSLRMSVGIHSGDIDFFLIGGLHRELIVAGPAVSRTVLMESTATAGEIVLSPEAAALVPKSALGRWKEEGYLLRSAPDAPVTRAGQVDVPEGVDIETLVPALIREHLLSGGGETEHRRVVVAFLKFTGLDALLSESGPAEVAVALDRLVRIVQDAAIEYEVSFHETDIDADGGKILLVAGAPRSSGKDEERMLRVVRAIADSVQPLPLKIGVNDGYVFAGDFGPPYRRSYSIKGDSVNLSARIMSKAQPGQILVTRSVLERSRTEFESEALEPFTVKGKAKPVEAFSLGAITGTKGVEAASLPFIGRELEMEAIVAGLDSARNGDGRLIELIGEPGIGKSRLVAEVRERTEGMVVVSISCEQYESTTPYFPFRALLRSVLGIADRDDPETAGRILQDRVEELAPELLPWIPLIALPVDARVAATPEVDRLDDEFRQGRLHETVGELLPHLLPSPALLVFEDVHWMDEASNGLLRHVANDVPSHPWVVLVTRRDIETGFVAPGTPPSISLRPKPLHPDETAAVIGAATEDAPLPAHEMALLAERSGGNPLFLRELLEAARRAGTVEGLPDTVEGVITAQIDGLDARDRHVLRYASVLGVSFTEHLLQAALADDTGPTDEGVWRRLAQFVEEERDGGDAVPSFRFRHALIRDAAYEGLPYRRRRELHGRVGDILELTADDRPEAQAELLSLHFFHAQRFDKAWTYSVVAGERATTKFANVQAAEFYRRGLEAARRLGDIPAAEVMKISEALGDVQERAGLYAEAAVAYRAARARAADPISLAALMFKEATIRERAGRYADAVRWYRRGLRAIGSMDGKDALRWRAELEVGLGAIRQGQGRFSSAIRLYEEAVHHAEAAGARAVMAHAAYMLDLAYTESGRPEGAPFPGLALSIYEELDDLVGQAMVYNNAGVIAYFSGRWDQAVDMYERALRLREKIGDSVKGAMGHANVGEIRIDQGRFDEAEPMLREALRVWKAARFRQGIGFAKYNLGRLAARTKRYDEASKLLDEARQELRGIGEERVALDTEARMAESLVLQGRTQEALMAIDALLKRSTDLGGMPIVVPVLQRLRGWALMQQGDLEHAGAALQASLTSGRAQDAAYEIGLTLNALATLARLQDEDAARYETESQAILDGLGVVSLPDIPLPALQPAG